MIPSLAKAVAHAYDTFAAPRPKVIRGCPCCIADKDVCTLISTPLRELTGEQLFSYTFSLFLTVGEEADFRYFLPRILEITATGEDFAADVEMAVGKLGPGGMALWPQAEREAVEAVLRGIIDDALLGGPGAGDRVEAVLCGVAKADLPLEPWFTHIAAPGFERVLHAVVARFWNGSKGRLDPGGGSAFWDDAPAARRAELATFLARYEDQAQDWVFEVWERGD